MRLGFRAAFEHSKLQMHEQMKMPRCAFRCIMQGCNTSSAGQATPAIAMMCSKVLRDPAQQKLRSSIGKLGAPLPLEDLGGQLKQQHRMSYSGCGSNDADHY